MNDKLPPALLEEIEVKANVCRPTTIHRTQIVWIWLDKVSMPCLWLELTLLLGGLHTFQQRCLRFFSEACRVVAYLVSADLYVGLLVTQIWLVWSANPIYGIADNSDQMASIEPYVGLDWYYQHTSSSRLVSAAADGLSCYLPEIQWWIGICWANPDALESLLDSFVLVLSWCGWDGQERVRSLRGVVTQVFSRPDPVTGSNRETICHSVVLDDFPSWMYDVWALVALGSS